MRNRTKFVLWLIERMRAQGVELPERPTHVQLQEAVEKYGVLANIKPTTLRIKKAVDIKPQVG